MSRDLGICQKCNVNPATHFRAVGSDPNRFTWDAFERWCIQCEDEASKRLDDMLTKAREERNRKLYPGYQVTCISCGKPITPEQEWCPEPCHTDLRDSNNRIPNSI